jgi:hypothetical protein
MIWHYIIVSCLSVWLGVVLTLYIVRRRRAQVSTESPEPQPIQQVPRHTRRQLARGQTPKPERPVTETRTH